MNAVILTSILVPLASRPPVLTDSRRRTAAAACILADGSLLLVSEWHPRSNLGRLALHRCQPMGRTWLCGPPRDISLPGELWSMDHPVLWCSAKTHKALLYAHLKPLAQRPGRVVTASIRIPGACTPLRAPRCRQPPRAQTLAPVRLQSLAQRDWVPTGIQQRHGQIFLTVSTVPPPDRPACVLVQCSNPRSCRPFLQGPGDAGLCSMVSLSTGPILAVYRNAHSKRRWCEWALWRGKTGWVQSKRGLGPCRPRLAIGRAGRWAVQPVVRHRARHWWVELAHLWPGAMAWASCPGSRTSHRILPPLPVLAGDRAFVFYPRETEHFRFELRSAPCGRPAGLP